MKTQTKKQLVLGLCLLQACLSLIGCGQNSGSSTAAAPGATNGQFVMLGSNCVLASNTSVVEPLTACQTNGYANTYNNGYTNTGGSGLCVGQYVTVNGSNMSGYCYGSPDNCAGWPLRSLTTGQVVTCI